MAKLLINENKKLLVGSGGKAYAITNLDEMKGATSPVDITAAAGRILKLTRYGKCEQNGTPTPSAPVDIVCNNGALKFSVNMANVNAQTALVGYYINASGVVTADIYNWIYQEYIRVKPSTTYTLSMSQSVYFVSISEYSTAADSGFVVRKTGATGSNTSLTITTGANTNFIRFGTNLSRTQVTLAKVLAINWMLNEGSTAIPYAPYAEGGIYTDGTPEVLMVSRENLFDSSSYTEINAYVNANTGVLTAGSPGSMTQYCAVIPCKPNTQYNITGQGTSAWGAFPSNSIGTAATAFVKGGILTTGANDRYLIGLVRANGDSIDYRNTLVVQEAQTASVANLLQVGDYKDEQEIISGLLTHKIGIMVFDGTENWRRSSSGGNIYILTSAVGVNLSAICTHFQKISNTVSSVNMPDGSFRGHPSNTVLYFKYEAAGSVANFKDFLSSQYAAGTPVIMLYSLATETTEQLTPQPLTTTEGTNTITDVAEVSNPEFDILYKI